MKEGRKERREREKEILYPITIGTTFSYITWRNIYKRLYLQAAREGHDEIVLLLLDRGADANLLTKVCS